MGRHIALFLIVLFISCLSLWTRNAEAGITCLNEVGNPVDWWVILKAPLMPTSSDPSAASGFGYSYADSNGAKMTWTKNRLDTNLNGALGSTLSQIYNAHKANTAWLMYNDQTPDGKSHDSYGHTKGDMAFDINGGFWLVHSTPRFPAQTGNPYPGFPDYAKDYGQSFLCISLTISGVNQVGAAFKLNKPYIYDTYLPAALASAAPNIADVINSRFITTKAQTNYTTVYSRGRVGFTVFSKNAKSDVNLYSDVVEPVIQDGLLVESWMNGANDNKMPTFCTPTYAYDTINVRSVKLTTDVEFPETKDHSKWAVSISHPLLCIGDINRQYSQAKRGGGTVCFSNRIIYDSFSNSITDKDSC
jgi:deoxyribonuclease-2